ncbi:leucine--tRNA ligase, partial [Candidatus Woesearchaeota archaeon]|nr:leucine--tRNA ligase [Candidatus Woesearchaeota archaeon]
VVWCPKEGCPVSDHSRIEGEGETPQEFVLVKFKMGDVYLVAATLRPETSYGLTNVWVDPDTEYVKAKVNKETWIVSKECSEKLKTQERDVKILGKIKGKELLGQWCMAPAVNKEIMILPSHFCNPAKGTGIVMSVPSDAPDDWMGLFDIKSSEAECKKYGLDFAKVNMIHPIPIIVTPGLGDTAAIVICQQLGIKSQNDREKLEEAKQIVYKKGFYEGVMTQHCGKYANMRVEAAKEAIKQELIKKGQAELFYELTGKVICRCLTPSIVKIVDDQWFINYNDPEWKNLTHKALDQLKLYPEKARAQFSYVIDWLHEWACTREEGLGTRLPWDEKWLIESLSDSTLYMAYYTIAHLLQTVKSELVDDAFFDYVFLGKGDKKALKVDAKLVDKMRDEFSYWYPVDFRNSGKDLIQNHLTFYLFNHVAIFPQDKWPKGIGVNGWVTVDGQKMSKSLGNMIPVREMTKKYSADATRITILSGGEGMDDPNWDTEFATSIIPKLTNLNETCTQFYNKGRTDIQAIDSWAASRLHEIVRDATRLMEETMFRSAIQKIFFDTQHAMRWYLRRTNNNPNKKIINSLIEAQLIMLSPFTPHLCEETWEAIGKKGLVCQQAWPSFDEKKIDAEADAKEQLIRDTLADIKAVLKLAKVEQPKTITLFVSSVWKYNFYSLVKDTFAKTRDPKEILDKVMATELKKYGQDIYKVLPKLIKQGEVPLVILSQTKELATLKEAKGFLEAEYGCKVDVIKAEEATNPKANNAVPGKVAILVA